jgi:O-6-methylguanine DNA methyltransferase
MTLPGTSKRTFERLVEETLALPPADERAVTPAKQTPSLCEDPEGLLQHCLHLIEHWGPECASLAHASPPPLDLRGSPFQRKVWRTLLLVPPGKTISYGRLAALAGSPGAARAVGTAMRMNRIPILVPCHRVVASNGPGGYGGGLALKQELLDLESGRLTLVPE